MMQVTGWGRLSVGEQRLIEMARGERGVVRLAKCTPGVAHGLGRSYGDQALNPGGYVWLMAGRDRLIAFDAASGVLICEAGVTLREIQRLFVPRGWALPVTPGTQLVTVGGAIANDVHGKNHHVMGSFGDHVVGLTLARTSGETIECGRDIEPEWFAATIGGAGLTGVITTASLQLRPIPGALMDTESIPFASLAEFFALADRSEPEWEHTVAWIDCLSVAEGRGIFTRGNPAAGNANRRSTSLQVPFVAPISLINPLSLRLFNSAYYSMKCWQAGRKKVHHEAFLYPLDGIAHWNRLYGPNGFYQYQSVVPRSAGLDATRAMLKVIACSGEGSFLAVLKTFGERTAPGMLSFPMPGVTLALDFRNAGARTHRLFETLDAIVREAGGRIYLAKDARMPRSLFEAGYPALSRFLAFRDPGISSAMSRRLMRY